MKGTAHKRPKKFTAATILSPETVSQNSLSESQFSFNFYTDSIKIIIFTLIREQHRIK